MFLFNVVVSLVKDQQKRKRLKIQVNKLSRRNLIKPKKFFLEIAEPPNEQLEEEWQNNISERLSHLLQGLEETTVSKSDVCPFDALSEVPVDDQRLELFFFPFGRSIMF